MKIVMQITESNIINDVDREIKGNYLANTNGSDNDGDFDVFS